MRVIMGGGGTLGRGARRVIAIVLASSLVSACALALGPAPDIYDLQPATRFPDSLGRSQAHLAIVEPTAIGALDSERIAIRVAPTQISFLSGARWNDRAPRLVQRRLIESFQNSGRIRSVGLPGGAVVNDVGLVSDLRVFHVDATKNVAEVEIEARLVSDATGRVIASRRFSAASPVDGAGRIAMASALDVAFAAVAADIVTWTLARI